MQSLSNTLYQQASEQTDEYHKEACFQWIWYWLFINQPIEVIQQELADIESLTDNGHNNLLELAWKAEALERLLED